MNGLPVIATKNGAPVEINQVCVPYNLCHAINVKTHFKRASLCLLFGRFQCRCSTMVSLSIHMIRMPLQMHCINFFLRSNSGQDAEKMGLKISTNFHGLNIARITCQGY
jgi:hypothetical protein